MIDPAAHAFLHEGAPFPPGRFWTRADLIDSTAEELDALNRGDLTSVRVQEIAAMMQIAQQRLAQTETQGSA